MSFQKCPVCDGVGHVSGGYFARTGDYNTWLSGDASESCIICDGTGLIDETTGLPPKRREAMTNPYLKKVADEMSGIEVKNSLYEAWEEGYEACSERERQHREYQGEAAADRAIDREMQLRDARAGGQADLIEKFNKWADERKAALESMPISPIGRRDRVSIFGSAKTNLARLAKEVKDGN